ncbi:MAG: LacI family DNA-binding transcriptional regulator [Acidimicrobiales bacterium]
MGEPTMDHVAERAGVSRALVSLVMRNSPRVSDESRKKVLAAAQELGYRPNVWARNLASGQTHTIGVMLNDLHNPYFTEMAEGAAAAATEANMQVLIASGWQREDGDADAISALLDLRTRGIILGAARVAHDLFDEVATQVPVVAVAVFDRPDRFDTVCNDESIGTELVVEHLAALGHERIAHISGGDAPSGPERRSGFIEAMVRRGLAPVVVDGGFEEHAGHAAATQLMALKEPPTAIFAANDLCASGVLTALRDLDLSVPDDVSVVGYDDTLLAGIGAMSLTTVHQPRQQFGRRAMELLLERIEGRTVARHELIEPRLVTRSSTSQVRAKDMP